MAGRKRTKEERLHIEKMKQEIAQELGLLEKIKNGGWGELNAVESGKIGGILSKRLKK